MRAISRTEPRWRSSISAVEYHFSTDSLLFLKCSRAATQSLRDFSCSNTSIDTDELLSPRPSFRRAYAAEEPWFCSCLGAYPGVGRRQQYSYFHDYQRGPASVFAVSGSAAAGGCRSAP